jgi:PAS domain S-box-containing protein
VRVSRAGRESIGPARGNETLEETQEIYDLRTVTGEPFSTEALPVARALQGEIVSNVEMRGRDDAGNELYMLVSAAPMRGLQGKVEGVVTITHDISALRQSEFTAAIRASELEATFETMADAVFVFGSEGQVVRMNAAARELFVQDADIDLSQPLRDRGYKTVVLDEHDQIIPEDQWPLFRVVRGEVLTSANAVDMRVRTAMGCEVDLSVSGAPLLDHQGHIIGAVCICRDVTERRMLERRTNDALAEARTNEIALRAANEQMEEFLGMISHELKTPLTSIKGNTQLAMRQLKNSMQTFEKMLQLEESAEQQTRRLNRMVDDLLDVSRSRAGRLDLRLAPCDLVAILQESVEEQRKVWPERTIILAMPSSLQVLPSESAKVLPSEAADEKRSHGSLPIYRGGVADSHFKVLPSEAADAKRSHESGVADSHFKVPILADADRIEQVIMNYLTNALKYSDDNRPVEVSLRLEGDEVQVAVRDEGPGLSAEDQQRVWERFQRISGIETRSNHHSSTAGLGLGLYICKTIIEGHYGRVGVESTPGEGSTFWFTLPRARQEGQEH